ncbi:MAG: hypothetical protein ACRETN_06445 [Nevskiales bacterium]
MEPALKLALTASGLFLLTGLLTGVWKYAAIARSADAKAPVYVDIAHRAALLYSFAALVIAKFVEYSAWSETVDLLAVFFPVLYFALAIGGYVLHGLLRDTDNQFLKPHVVGRWQLPPVMLTGFMWTLIAAEIGGFSVLFAGFVKTVFLS